MPSVDQLSAAKRRQARTGGASPAAQQGPRQHLGVVCLQGRQALVAEQLVARLQAEASRQAGGVQHLSALPRAGRQQACCPAGLQHPQPAQHPPCRAAAWASWAVVPSQPSLIRTAPCQQPPAPAGSGQSGRADCAGRRWVHDLSSQARQPHGQAACVFTKCHLWRPSTHPPGSTHLVGCLLLRCQRLVQLSQLGGDALVVQLSVVGCSRRQQSGEEQWWLRGTGASSGS